jgi:thiamine-monophosphate kinase
MSGSEADLIARYFAVDEVSRDDVILGIGDDGAVLRVPSGKELVVSIDTLLAGVHFPHDTDPASIGYKAMAVNLSDMAAMGAVPAWATLSLVLPEKNHDWLKAFSRGFFELAHQFNVQLVGGDTCRGELAITVQLHGFVNTGEFLRRDTARPGDLVYVTGVLGDAGLAMLIKKYKHKLRQKDYQYLSGRLDRPFPRVEAGQSLRGIAHAVIDISDGLASDLGHILASSRVGATLFIDKIPISPVFASCKDWLDDGMTWVDLAISYGDDYELCFTIDPRNQNMLEQQLLNTPYTCIGEITTSPGLHCILENGEAFIPRSAGYDHFSGM